MGRKPIPNAVLKMRGSYRKDQHGDRVEVDPSIPSCPSWVGAKGKAEWRRLIAIFRKSNILTQLDRGPLAMHCHAYQVFLDAREDVERDGLIATGANGPIQNPAVRIMNQAWSDYMKSAGEFGFTPVSRCRVQSVGKPKEVDDLDAFIDRKKRG